MNRTLIALAVTALLAPFPATDRQNAQEKAVFRSAVDLVHLDVSVLDEARRPVSGLGAADFTILEDGKPQPIVVFSAVNIPPPVLTPHANWMREVSADIQTNETERSGEGRLFVLFIDDALLPSDLWTLERARAIGRGVVERLSPGDEAAIVFSFASRNAQTFTSDRVKLLAAINSLQGGWASYRFGWDSPLASVDSDAGLRLGSLTTLQSIAEALLAAPKRRKAIILISPGVPIDFARAAQPVRAGRDTEVSMAEANQRLVSTLPGVVERLAHANVTVYPVDPCGLGGLEEYIAQAVSGAIKRSVDPARVSNRGAAPVPSTPQEVARHGARLSMDFLFAAASNTGGRAIVNTNDFEPGLDAIFRENVSYYLLGYVRPARHAPGSIHRLTVEVNRRGAIVRARDGYKIEGGAQTTRTETVASMLAQAVDGPLPNSGLPLQVALAPVASSTDPGSAVTIALGFREAAVTRRTQQTITIRTSIFTPDGRGVGTPLQQTARFNLAPGTGDEVRYEWLAHMPLAPGRYVLRIAAHRATDGATGSVYGDVDVPNFRAARLSVSGLWLDARPGPSTLAPNTFKSLLPVVPTSSRQFRATDTVTAFFRVVPDRRRSAFSGAAQSENCGR